MVAKRLLGLIVGRLDLTFFYLSNLRIGVYVSKGERKILRIVRFVIAANDRIEDLIKSAKELFLSKRNELLLEV